jgi:hypothetical protein
MYFALLMILLLEAGCCVVVHFLLLSMIFQNPVVPPAVRTVSAVSVVGIYQFCMFADAVTLIALPARLSFGSALPAVRLDADNMPAREREFCIASSATEPRLNHGAAASFACESRFHSAPLPNLTISHMSHPHWRACSSVKPFLTQKSRTILNAFNSVLTVLRLRSAYATAASWIWVRVCMMWLLSCFYRGDIKPHLMWVCKGFIKLFLG